MPPPTPAARLRRHLKTTFGLQALRDGQQAVIDRVLAGQPTLAIMPTGAGKSLCYQLPALALGVRALVVSPLLALMKDQCDKLVSLGLPAVQVHAALNAADRDAALAAVADGTARFIFVTPERLAEPDFAALLKDHPPGLLVVDEAHCIAQWGHDFRPAFLDIGAARTALGRPAVLALTATASTEAVAEIRSRLGIPADGVLSTGTWRENLHYRVEHIGDEGGKLERVLSYVKATEGPGLVYTATVKAAEAVARSLALEGESVACYHGRLPPAERQTVQDDFMAGRVRVVVATNAFGLGIDKPDTRFVLHYQMPGTLDAYYQESGRAGRDGAAADCTLLFLRGDRAVQQFFLAGRFPGPADLEAVYQHLQKPPPADTGWTVEALADAAQRPKTKVHAVVSLLRQGKAVGASKDGRLTLKRPDLVADELARLQAGYVRKREQAQATLEGMVHYAMTSRCRWAALLDHFGEAVPFENGCGSCDNCVRLAAHAGPPVAADGAEAASAHLSAATPAWAPGDAVQVRRYGVGTVVAADAGAITVRFAEGGERMFLPEYVKAAPRRRRAAAPPVPLTAVPTAAG